MQAARKARSLGYPCHLPHWQTIARLLSMCRHLEHRFSITEPLIVSTDRPTKAREAVITE
jgi:hypothetical protein